MTDLAHRAIRVPPPAATSLRRWAAGVTAWGGTVLVLSATGALAWIPLLALPALIATGMIVPLVLIARSPTMRRLVRETDIAHLTWFNTWRVVAALTFFATGAAGRLPSQFVANAAWGDLIAGALAPIVVLAAAHLSTRTRVQAYLAFHLFSFGDFILAVGTGATFTLLGDPLMRTLLDTPMALIPLWGVPITGTISLLALHRLLTRRGQS